MNSRDVLLSPRDYMPYSPSADYRKDHETHLLTTRNQSLFTGPGQEESFPRGTQPIHSRAWLGSTGSTVPHTLPSSSSCVTPAAHRLPVRLCISRPPHQQCFTPWSQPLCPQVQGSPPRWSLSLQTLCTGQRSLSTGSNAASSSPPGSK